MSSTVSITSADLEKQSIDPTPQELLDIRKKQKPELEIALYSTLVNLKDLQVVVAKLRAENEELTVRISELTKESKKAKKD